MKKLPIKRFVIIALAILTVMGIGYQTVPADAATYKTVSTQSLKTTAYHKKSTKGAVYNQSHTRKIANLKSYPNTTWYVSKKVVLRHGKTNAVYYYAVNGRHTVKGLIWHGYLKKGKAPFVLKKAKAAVAVNEETGKVVWSKHANTARPIASVSKIMTLYLVLQKIHTTSAKWSDHVKTSNKGLVSMGNSYDCGGFRFKSGHKYTVQELYYAALLDSSNNAAIALGQWVSGSNAKFIDKMNTQAKRWNLGKAHFVSASGLENSDLQRFGYNYGSANANQVSAKDVAYIAQHLIQDYPQILKDGQIGSKKINGQTCYNYNNLLKGRKYYQASLKVDGLKTGYTPLVGYCFVGTAKKSGHNRIITVVLHDEDEFTETRSLMNYVYKNNLDK